MGLTSGHSHNQQNSTQNVLDGRHLDLFQVKTEVESLVSGLEEEVLSVAEGVSKPLMP